MKKIFIMITCSWLLINISTAFCYSHYTIGVNSVQQNISSKLTSDKFAISSTAQNILNISSLGDTIDSYGMFAIPASFNILINKTTKNNIQQQSFLSQLFVITPDDDSPNNYLLSLNTDAIKRVATPDQWSTPQNNNNSNTPSNPSANINTNKNGDNIRLGVVQGCMSCPIGVECVCRKHSTIKGHGDQCISYGCADGS